MTIDLSDNARIVLDRRYLKRSSDGNVVETPEEMFDRVARTIAGADAAFDENADVDETADRFRKMMTRLEFLPNSPTLMNAGRDLGQLAACFVLPVDDSMESIFETLKHTAMIHKSGGGTGFSFSRIRPARDVVRSTAGVSSGPISFMAVYDTATETVKQGGTRRGANMAVLRVDHPDIEAFIEAKSEARTLNNFNISVAITDDFMTAVADRTDYPLVNPRTGRTVRRVQAEDLFARIADAAWETGEPGVLFIDRMNADNPTPNLGTIEATNPCGEQPLLPCESCTLGSINLARMVKDGDLDTDRLWRTVRDAVHFLDNVVEVNRYPLPVIAEMSRRTRKIGLGVMGFADMLIRMGIPYNDEAAEAEAEAVMSQITAWARAASAELAETRGSFPAYPGSIFDDPATPAMRNATVTTVAPTGTISLIAGVSSGIEPLFAVAHARHVLNGEILNEVHPLFREIAKEEGFDSPELEAEVVRTGSLRGVESVPESVRRLFSTAHEIAPEWHLRIQAAFQRHTDNAVSKTVNLPADATRQAVADIYRQAFEAGLKGVTLYRDRSRADQVLRTGPGQRGAESQSGRGPRPRPEKTEGYTRRVRTGCGNLYVTVNSDDDGICEVFAQMGKSGGCASSQTEAAGRLISLALRSGIPPDAVVKQLIGIRCPSPTWKNGRITLSCPDAIAQVLQAAAGDDIPTAPVQPGIDLCPECGGAMTHDGGCRLCRSCGFSKCN